MSKLSEKKTRDIILEIYNSVLEKSVNCDLIFACKHQYCSFYILSGKEFDTGELLEYLKPHMLELKFEKQDFGRSEFGETWRVYLVNWDFDIEVEAELETFHSGDFTFIKETSGSFTLTHWNSLKRWHFFKTGVPGRRMIQDIYCGIRRIIMRSVYMYGAVLLHAACFVMGNRTVLLLGKKEAGKSVLSYYSIFCLKTKYISGDQTLVWLDEDGKPHCWGVIASLRMNSNDWRLFPMVESAKALKSYIAGQVLDPDKLMGNKVAITPDAFAKITGTSIVPISRPDIIIFLENRKDTDGFIRLSREKVRTMLEEHCLEDMTADIYESDEQSATRRQKQTKAIFQISEYCEAYIMPSKQPLNIMGKMLKEICSF